MSDQVSSIEEVMDVLKEDIEREFFLTKRNSSVRHDIERTYNPEIIKRYYVAELIPNGEEFVVKFKKRIRELSEEEYVKEYWPKGRPGGK